MILLGFMLLVDTIAMDEVDTSKMTYRRITGLFKLCRNVEVLNINVKGKYLVTVGAANTEEPKLFSETKLEVGVKLTVIHTKKVN